MASASWSTLLLAAALICAMQQASAHCGSLHNWTWSTPDHANYTRIQLATAKGFKFYNASTASSYMPAALPFYPTAAPAAIVNGTVSAWEFLDTSCAETMTLSVNLKFTSPNGKPLPAGTKVYIYGFTGSCATGVQDLYRNNVTEGDNRCNLVWAGREDNFIGAQGSLVGSAPNIFFPRQNATSAGAALNSILIATPPSVGPLLCADLVWDKYDLAVWKKKVAACKPGQGTASHGRRLQRKLAL